MNDQKHLEGRVSDAIESGDYRTVMMTIRNHLKRDLTVDEADALTINCLRWSGTALLAAKQGASRQVIEKLIGDYISDGDGVSANLAAALNDRTLAQEEVDAALEIAIQNRCAFSKILQIASLGISKKYQYELVSAYNILQEDEKSRAIQKL